MTDTTAPLAARPAAGASPVRLARVGLLLLFGQLAWALPATASVTLLQSLADDVDPLHKVRVVALIGTAGAVTSAVGTVGGGLLSDRTRSRLGRRSPWLIASALLAVAALAACGTTTDLVTVGALYAVFQLGIGTWVAALSALLPDHVAPGSTGRASAFAGIGYLLGQTAGGVLGGLSVTHPGRGMALAPWLMVLAALLVAVCLPAADNRSAPRPPLRGSELRPPATRDFWLAFAGRFLFILAIVLVTQYLLYVFTDHLGLTKDDAGRAAAAATGLVGVLAAVTTVGGGLLSDRLGRTKIFVGGAPLLLGAGAVPVLVAPGTATMFVFCAAVGLTLGTYLSVDQALMVAVLPDAETSARDLGVLQIGSTLPGVVAPVVGGALIGSAGYPGLFLVSLVLAVAAAAVITTIRSVR